MLGVHYFIPALASECAAVRRRIEDPRTSDSDADKFLESEERTLTHMSITPASNTDEVKLKAAALFAAASGDFSCLDVAGLMLLRSIFADIERL